MIHTIDGTPSASSGSNNNGGEVAEHRRSANLVTCVGRLHYLGAYSVILAEL